MARPLDPLSLKTLRARLASLDDELDLYPGQLPQPTLMLMLVRILRGWFDGRVEPDAPEAAGAVVGTSAYMPPEQHSAALAVMPAKLTQIAERLLDENGRCEPGDTAYVAMLGVELAEEVMAWRRRVALSAPAPPPPPAPAPQEAGGGAGATEPAAPARQRVRPNARDWYDKHEDAAIKHALNRVLVLKIARSTSYGMVDGVWHAKISNWYPSAATSFAARNDMQADEVDPMEMSASSAGSLIHYICVAVVEALGRPYSYAADLEAESMAATAVTAPSAAQPDARCTFVGRPGYGALAEWVPGQPDSLAEGRCMCPLGHPGAHVVRAPRNEPIQ